MTATPESPASAKGYDPAAEVVDICRDLIRIDTTKDLATVMLAIDEAVTFGRVEGMAAPHFPAQAADGCADRLFRSLLLRHTTSLDLLCLHYQNGRFAPGSVFGTDARMKPRRACVRIPCTLPVATTTRRLH